MFLTEDASDKASIGITTDELYEWLKPAKIRAQKRVLILDACNSGAVINDWQKGSVWDDLVKGRGGDFNDQIKAIDKLNEKSGMFILSASASDQDAYELDTYKQGLLTYSLLKVLKEDPGILDDSKYLNVGKWFMAAENIANDMLKKRSRKRQDPKIAGAGNFNIGWVDESLIASIKLPGEKILVTSSQLLNDVTKLDDLGLRKSVDSLLDIYGQKEEGVLVFNKGYEGADVYGLSGAYQISNKQINIQVILQKEQHELKSFKLSGPIDQRTQLAESIVKNAVDWFSTVERKR